MSLKDLHLQDMDQIFSANPSGNKLADTSRVCFSFPYFDVACTDVWDDQIIMGESRNTQSTVWMRVDNLKL
jgi:hypothetical protein